MSDAPHDDDTYDAKRAKLLKWASWIATLAAIISLGLAICQAAALNSSFSMFLTIIVPLASFLPALALLTIAMQDYGIKSWASRIAGILIVFSLISLFLLAISLFFIC